MEEWKSTEIKHQKLTRKEICKLKESITDLGMDPAGLIIKVKSILIKHSKEYK
jgi:hypothetical protein